MVNVSGGLTPNTHSNDERKAAHRLHGRVRRARGGSRDTIARYPSKRPGSCKRKAESKLQQELQHKRRITAALRLQNAGPSPCWAAALWTYEQLLLDPQVVETAGQGESSSRGLSSEINRPPRCGRRLAQRVGGGRLVVDNACLLG